MFVLAVMIRHFIIECTDEIKSVIQFNDEEEKDEDEEEDEQELDIEKVNTYLELLDSDIDYNDWLSVGMALKNEGYDFEIWDSWSSTGSKYNKSEMKNKWKSFQKNDLSINKIISLVKDYNIEGYNELQQEKIPEFIDKPEDLKPEPKVDPFFLKSISGLESDIANYI